MVDWQVATPHARFCMYTFSCRRVASSEGNFLLLVPCDASERKYRSRSQRRIMGHLGSLHMRFDSVWISLVATHLEDTTTHGKLACSIPLRCTKERVGFIISARCWAKDYDHLNFDLSAANDPNTLNNTLPKSSVSPCSASL